MVETAKGLRAEAYERGRQRVDLHLAKGDTTCGYSCLAKMLLILGARQLVLEGPAALIILARPQFESAGLTVRASVVLTPYLAKALVGDVSDFDV